LTSSFLTTAISTLYDIVGDDQFGSFGPSTVGSNPTHDGEAVLIPPLIEPTNRLAVSIRYHHESTFVCQRVRYLCNSPMILPGESGGRVVCEVGGLAERRIGRIKIH